MACDELSSARESDGAQGGASPTLVRPVLPLLRRRSTAFCVLLPMDGQHALPGLSRSLTFSHRPCGGPAETRREAQRSPYT